MHPLPWAVDAARPAPALLHPGLGRGWWCWSGGRAVADDHRLWVLDGGRAIPVPLPEGPDGKGEAVDQVCEDDGGIVVTAGSHTVRLARAGAVATCDHAPRRAVPGGTAEVWVDEEAGFVYRRASGRTRAIDVVRPGEAVLVGPHGALLVGARALTRGGAPGRSPRPLPVPLAPEPVRWAVDGQRVAGLGEAGPVVLDLTTGGAEPAEGVPVAIDAWLRRGRIWQGGRAVQRGLVEASAAVWGPWLAGPGGWVWSLPTGRPVADRRAVALGATVGTALGFVTVDWETGRGWTAGFDGQRQDPFTLPLAPDDTVVAGRSDGDAAWFETALGDQLRVWKGEVARGGGMDLDPPIPTRLMTPAGPFQATAQAEVDGIRFAANDDGWLIALDRRAPDAPP